MDPRAVTDGPPKEARKRTGRRRKTRREMRGDDVVHYIVAIEDWDWSFLFMAGDHRFQERRYSDYRHLQIFGKLIRPTKMNAETVELTFLPDYRNDERSSGPPAHLVGSIGRGRFTALLTMPADVLPPILQMLIAGKFRFVVMSGTRPRYGRGSKRTGRTEASLSFKYQ